MSENLNIIVARNVRKIRKEKGISQEQLAIMCGLHRTYIGSVERGERNLTLVSLQRIATALGAKPEELLREQI
jgi:transcriptional regulator with XRE-family HTH domain